MIIDVGWFPLEETEDSYKKYTFQEILVFNPSWTYVGDEDCNTWHLLSRIYSKDESHIYQENDV